MEDYFRKMHNDEYCQMFKRELSYPNKSNKLCPCINDGDEDQQIYTNKTKTAEYLGDVIENKDTPKLYEYKYLPHGKGILLTPNSTFKGNFENGCKAGLGTSTFKNGAREEAGYLNGYHHGSVKDYTSKNVLISDILWEKGMPTFSNIRIRYDDKYKYEYRGEIDKNQTPSGYGTEKVYEKDPSGNIVLKETYAGYFVHGVRHGDGFINEQPIQYIYGEIVKRGTK